MDRKWGGNTDAVVYELRIGEIKKLQTIVDERPLYFGRVDVQLDGAQGEIEQIYIGKLGFQPEAGGEILIHDWRAPISQLYYQRSLGQTTYHPPGGQCSIRITLRRTFDWQSDIRIVENQYLPGFYELTGSVDESILITTSTSVDDFLNGILNSQTVGYLRDIVRTIAQDQDIAIRHPSKRTLMIGAAGTGKTIVALHRTAFLLYESRQRYVSSRKDASTDVLLLSPSRLFASYVTNVLPSLYESPPRSVTFADLFVNSAKQLLEKVPGGSFSVETPHLYQTRFLSSSCDQVDAVIGAQIKNFLVWTDAAADFVSRYRERITERFIKRMVRQKDWLSLLQYIISEYIKNPEERGILIETILLFAECFVRENLESEAALVLKKAWEFDKSAMLYARLGDQTASLECWAQHLERRGESVSAAELYRHLGLYERAGDCYKKDKKYDDAIRCYLHAADKGRDRERDIHVAIAECYEGMNDFSKAATYYERAGVRGKMHRCRGSHYMLEGRYELAAECFLKASWYTSAAECYLSAGRYVDSAQYFARSGEYIRAAVLYAFVGQPKEAAECLEGAEEYLAAGMYYRSAGQDEKAEECFRRADKDGDIVEVDPSAVGIEETANYLSKHEKSWYESIAEYYQSAGRYVDAAECYKKAGDYAAAIRIYEDMGLCDQAAICRQRMGNANVQRTNGGSDQQEATNERVIQARTAESQGRLLDAARLYEAALHFEEAAACYKRTGYLLNAAECYERAGKLAEASARYEEIGQYQKAGECCERISALEQAYQHYRKAGDLLCVCRCLVKMKRYDDMYQVACTWEYPTSALSPSSIINTLNEAASACACKELKELLEAVLEDCRYDWNPLSLYEQFWQDATVRSYLLQEFGDNWKIAERGIQKGLERLRTDKQLSWEDVAPLIYVAGKEFPLTAFREQIKNPSYLMIDEAQDLSPLHYECLRPFIPEHTWVTVCGDFNQVLVPTGSSAPDGVRNLLSIEHTTAFNYAYRSTAEIMNFAHAILDRESKVKPIRQSGELPCVIGFDRVEDMVVYLPLLIREIPHNSLCVVCRSDDQAREVYDLLHTSVPQSVLLSSNSQTPLAGVFVASIATVKGVEFDAVIVYNTSEDYYNAKMPMSRNHLYVACTRALHHLYLLYTGVISPLIPLDERKTHFVGPSSSAFSRNPAPRYYHNVSPSLVAAALAFQKAKRSLSNPYLYEHVEKYGVPHHVDSQANQTGTSQHPTAPESASSLYYPISPNTPVESKRVYSETNSQNLPEQVAGDLEKRGCYIEAAKEYEKAGRFTDAARCRARHYEKQGNYQVASIYYKQAGLPHEADRCSRGRSFA